MEMVEDQIDKQEKVIHKRIMSSIDKSMVDDYKGNEPLNHIRLEKNICGAVYKVSLDSNYNGTSMEAMVVGQPLDVNDTYANEWTCHPDSISNPDNITYIGHNTLLISEDTTKHVNNMSWAYNTQTKTMTRTTKILFALLHLTRSGISKESLQKIYGACLQFIIIYSYTTRFNRPQNLRKLLNKYK